MQNNKHFFVQRVLAFLWLGLMMTTAYAGVPLWTFEPQTPTNITVAKGASAQVIYTVQNQSSRTKTLMMKPITGISQGAPCQLPAAGLCTLTLNVNGSTLQGDVLGGPVLCEQGNDLQCYQPSLSNMLRIRLIEQPPIEQFTVTPSAGANGSISPSTPQVVNAGSALIFTATPNPTYGVNQWLLDSAVVQNGGSTYQLTNIQANHTVQVTFGQTTLTPSTQNLALSINSSGATPPLSGNSRIIRIQNTGSILASNVQVSPSGLPTGTSISNGCTGTLNAGASCDITITPGSAASVNNSANACTVSPGTAPVPGTVTISAENAASTTVNVLVLGYGCIYQGGFLFSVDDATPNTGSIGGKVAALTDEPSSLQWATLGNNTSADSITDGLANTNALATPSGQYPAAQACLDKSEEGFTDWYLPAICELGRAGGKDAGCGNALPNLYTTLRQNNLGSFKITSPAAYWSSSEYTPFPSSAAWYQNFQFGDQLDGSKTSPSRLVRCVRVFTP